tara:strand:+ start:191 stop:349 length:159 start_codon:yes stop_codon:yes gene_type:complete
MWIAIIIGGVIAIFIGWMAQDVLYWQDYPMDHSNLIPLVILVMALSMFLALL